MHGGLCTNNVNSLKKYVLWHILYMNALNYMQVRYNREECVPLAKNLERYSALHISSIISPTPPRCTPFTLRSGNLDLQSDHNSYYNVVAEER